MRTSLILSILISLSISLFAQGRIVLPERPSWRKLPQVYLKAVNVSVDLKQEAGTVRLEQTFFNPSDVRLEGEYLFAIPQDAEIHDFHLYINGKKTRGEILDSKEASRIYQDIVRRLRDPALLEYSGNSLFKARIFPIEPKRERKIELTYAQVVQFREGTFRFTLPIRQSGQGSIERFHLRLNLETAEPLANIYSPSHRIEVERLGERRAKITLEASNLEGDRDFILYYSLENKEINTSVLTFRPRTDRDGYFMLLTTPRYAVAQQQSMPKDIIFVIDVSGSMQGEKIAQAKQALQFCVNTLKPGDRFEIIRFSTAIEAFQGGLRQAGADEKKNAVYFIDNLNASGGTNINRALQEALRLKPRDDQRPTSIVFLTDGLPTEGETGVKRILQNVKTAGKNFIRIFSFGVGYDVNTFLLDKLSRDSHGSANYVKPGENIEREIAGFFTKISSPVLTGVQMDFGNLKVYDVYPQQLPDLFRGQRLSIIGRYRVHGQGSLRLTGKQDGRSRAFNYRVNFPRREEENEFIAKLWANRKVAHLLEQIRFNGENPELVQSVKNLSEEYGIVTPYTSYLVRQQQKEFAYLDDIVARGAAGGSALRMEAKKSARAAQAEVDEESLGSAGFYDALIAAPAAAQSATGKGAVMSSRALKKVATTDKEMEMLLTVKWVGGKSFHLKKGVWVETGLQLDSKPDVTIAFLSEAYFALCGKNREIRRILALGEQVIFRWQGKVYRVKS